ncbi:hypothetical protein DFP73DRAFT_595735 [Morchella snyderi]|nr:hypothetical protein DFP73DRAFT_595735 [Morchella snyderi]
MASGGRAFRRESIRMKSIPSRERQAKEHSVGIASGVKALRRGERITIGAREKLSIRLGALGTLVRARAECFTPEGARGILLLLWRGMTPFGEGLDYREEFLIVNLVVTFRGGVLL